MLLMGEKALGSSHGKKAKRRRFVVGGLLCLFLCERGESAAPGGARSVRLGTSEYVWTPSTGMYKRTIGEEGPLWLDANQSQERIWCDRGWGVISNGDDDEQASDYVGGSSNAYTPLFTAASEEVMRVSSLGYDLQFRPPLTENLSDLARRVLLQGETEPPFAPQYVGGDGSYLGELRGEEAVVLACAASGLPVFCSTDAFKSTSGWPSFRRPIAEDHIVRRGAEVLCARSLTHLGHAIDEGSFTRFCVNAAALAVYDSPASARPVAQGADRHPALEALLLSKRRLSTAQFAMGCYWNSQLLFERVPGTIKVEAGFAASPQCECVRITFDDQVCSYDDLLTLFFASHDSTAFRAQGARQTGRGKYRNEVHALTKEQASAARNQLDNFGEEIATQVIDCYDPEPCFLPAHDQHFLRDTHGKDASKAPIQHLARLPNKLQD